jgi:hypothetical protein
MKIDKTKLKTFWYADENCKEIPQTDDERTSWEPPKNAVYYFSRFPMELTETMHRLVLKDEVDKCIHPSRFIERTSGWIDGIVGRECTACGGTQTKKKWHLWPSKWDAEGSNPIATFHSTWSEDLVLAMANSGDYTLSEAILVASIACERCMNVLANKYGLDWGYEEYSSEWEDTNTECEFCKDEPKADK